ncbi:MAG: thioredoxin family protein, partial [Flavobacteriales bacterium]
MKTVLLALSLLASAAFPADINEVLEIGKTAPMAGHKMMDVSGKTLSLDDIKEENGLLVVFSC